MGCFGVLTSSRQDAAPVMTLWTMMIGCVVGVFARLLAPGRKGPFGFLLTITLGIIGAFAAPHLGQEAGWYSASDPAALLSAVAGAVIVLAIWALLFKSRNPTSSI
jgi:uncharacterized membrane protein YeaQ/YmgE (transglycosylase-associated protein family)